MRLPSVFKPHLRALAEKPAELSALLDRFRDFSLPTAFSAGSLASTLADLARGR